MNLRKSVIPGTFSKQHKDPKCQCAKCFLIVLSHAYLFILSGRPRWRTVSGSEEEGKAQQQYQRYEMHR